MLFASRGKCARQKSYGNTTFWSWSFFSIEIPFTKGIICFFEISTVWNLSVTVPPIRLSFQENSSASDWRRTHKVSSYRIIFSSDKTLMGILRFQVQICTCFDQFDIAKGNTCFYDFWLLITWLLISAFVIRKYVPRILKSSDIMLFPVATPSSPWSSPPGGRLRSSPPLGGDSSNRRQVLVVAEQTTVDSS